MANSDIPEPYRSIHDLPFDEHGWFVNAEPLSACFDEIFATTIIEVGSWLGSSTRFLANLVEKNGKVYAIDTWLGSSNEPAHEEDPRLSKLYQLFLSNIKHAKLTDIVVPIRMKSLEASQALNVMADLIYIDAAHDTESVYQDILAWYPHLNPGGIICGDDLTWPSVQEGVIEAAYKLQKSLHYHGPFWRFY